MPNNVVGIDLGTTNSLVATLVQGQPTILANRSGGRMTPSVVGLDSHDRIHVGETARQQLQSAPDRTVAEAKRLMGTAERVRLGTRTYTPTEISGLILASLKADAEAQFGSAVVEAVITVPAYFTDAQRQATKDAGELAGLKVERILNEPTAAALAYGLDNLDKEQHVLVYDLGGGTFDVSVLEMFQGVLEVKASAGNNRLGGADFDRTVASWLAAQFEQAHGLSVAHDAVAQARLKAAAEAAKIQLSSVGATQVLIPFLAQGRGGPLSLDVELTREQLERLLRPMIESTLAPVKSALEDAKLSREAVAEVVLVGGSSRLPLVRQLVAEFFGKEPRRGVNPDEAVALGAAVQAGLKAGALSSERGIMITDVCPFTLGVEVARAAGRERLTGVFSPIIARNTTVPVSRTEIYATISDGQRGVDIKVYQGESRLVRNNVFLDQYTVEGVPPAPAGAEKVAVTFTYDINGILDVRTKIVSTGKEAKLVIDRSPNRMSAGDREEARRRLEQEGSAPAAPLPVVAAQDPAGGAAGAAALLVAARSRLGQLGPEQRDRVAALVAQLEAAVAGNDPREVARLDRALTDCLFALG